MEAKPSPRASQRRQSQQKRAEGEAREGATDSATEPRRHLSVRELVAAPICAMLAELQRREDAKLVSTRSTLIPALMEPGWLRHSAARSSDEGCVSG